MNSPRKLSEQEYFHALIASLALIFQPRLKKHPEGDEYREDIASGRAGVEFVVKFGPEHATLDCTLVRDTGEAAPELVPLFRIIGEKPPTIIN
jgi:hypothetical protein